MIMVSFKISLDHLNCIVVVWKSEHHAFSDMSQFKKHFLQQAFQTLESTFVHLKEKTWCLTFTFRI